MQLAARDGRHSLSSSLAASPTSREVERSVLDEAFDMDGTPSHNLSVY